MSKKINSELAQKIRWLKEQTKSGNNLSTKTFNFYEKELKELEQRVENSKT